MNKFDKIAEWLNKTTLSEKDKKPAHPAKSALNAKSKSSFHKAPKATHVHHKHKFAPSHVHKDVMRVIPIGGLEEVGKNSMIVEYERDILVIDMGFQFPDDEFYGVDYIIPDITYLRERQDRIRGIVITHGHLDHIGAIPYVIRDLGFPTLYTSKLTSGLIKRALEEHKLLKEVTIVELDLTKAYRFGELKVDFFRVNHSIPDAFGVYVQSPQGSMVHTGDFKFDFSPADGIECDIPKMKEIGARSVDLMFSDSTNSTKPGHTLSEREVAHNLEKSIHGKEGRIIIACFASLIGRIQQILEFAQKENRKVFLAGRSMNENIKMAQEMGYIRVPKNLIFDIRNVNQFQDAEILILTTGSQGEPMAALTRMADGTHNHVQIQPGDNVVVSSSPIMGNEKATAVLVDRLSRLGANVIHNRIMDLHTTGHGQQEDLKFMMSLIKPKNLVPVHGNYYMRRAHGNLGLQMGIPAENIHMMDNGNVIEVKNKTVFFKHEDIKTKFVVIDGNGQGDVESPVHQEREVLAANGILSVIVSCKKSGVSSVVLRTHGFIYQDERTSMEKDLKVKVTQAVERSLQKNMSISQIETQLKTQLSGFILQKINRRPLVDVLVLPL